MPTLVDLRKQCEMLGCERRSAVQIVSDNGGTLGEYCQKHGSLQLRKVNAAAFEKRRREQDDS